jgi:hypothetical protein
MPAQHVSNEMIGIILLLFAIGVGAVFAIGHLLLSSINPPPSPPSPEELDQQAVLLRAETRRLQAQTENDEATMHAEMKRAELRDVRKFVTDHDRMNGGRV